MASYTTMNNGHCRVLIRRKSLGTQCRTFPNEEAARAWAEGEEAQMMTKVLAAPAARASGITLREAWENYAESEKFDEKAKSTQRRERQAIVPVLAMMGGLAIGAIDRVRMQFYFDKRGKVRNPKRKIKGGHPAGEKLSGDTLHREKEVISAVFRWALHRGYAHTNPTKHDLEMRECKIREARISVEQEDALYDAAWEYIEPGRRGNYPNPNLFPWFLFVMSTGTRPGEAAKIELEWVHVLNREIHIPRASHKTKRPRVILLTAKVAEIVRLQTEYAKKQGSGYLFFSRGAPGGKTKVACEFTPYAYSKPWRNICKRAGVPNDVVPHSGRREFISRMMERTGLSDSQIAVLVGDVHPLSLKPYTHLRVNLLRPQLDDFESVMSVIRTKHIQQTRAENDAAKLLKKLAAAK